MKADSGMGALKKDTTKITAEYLSEENNSADFDRMAASGYD